MKQSRAAVLGSPIGHSLSPVLHRAAYAALGVDADYSAIEVTESQLPAFIDSCGPEWMGLSLTMPLKTAVLPLLDEVSSMAARVGAVNTVHWQGSRRLGDNTDVPGMQHALRESAGADLQVIEPVVLGGGATARSAFAALAGMGAGLVHVCVRTPSRAAEFVSLAERSDAGVVVHPWSEADALLGSDVVVSTVPWGAADEWADAVPASPGVLLDVAYGSAAARLTQAWRANGGAVADGLDLLLWQAVGQVRLMTGREAPVEAMRQALRQATSEMMPGC